MNEGIDAVLEQLAESRDSDSTVPFLREAESVLRGLVQVIDSLIEGTHENLGQGEIVEALATMKLECEGIAEKFEAERSERVEGDDDDDADDEEDAG